METLPEDVVLEILARVAGIPDLFRCAATCKRWRLLIADGSFLRRRWYVGARRRFSFLGFFTYEQPHTERRVAGINPPPMPPFRPAPWLPFLNHSPRFLNIPEHAGYRTVLLTSRRGLVLVNLIQRSGGPIRHHHHQRSILLAVCDPLACKSRVLPPLNYSGLFKIVGCTVLTRADCCSNDPRPCPPAFFRVLIVSCHEEQYNLHVFTSTDSSWSTPARLFDHLQNGENILPVRQRPAVCQGTAHWLYEDGSSYCMLNVSTDTPAHVSVTKLPIAPNQPGGFDFYRAPFLTADNDEGVLSLLRLHKKCTGLEIWKRQGGPKQDHWHLAKMIRLKQPDRSKIHAVECMWAGEMSGALLIMPNDNCLYIADLETGAMETVTELFLDDGAIAVPFEMDWPTFFMSRLAAGGTTTGNNKLQAGAMLKGAMLKVANYFWGRIFGN